LVHLGEVQAGGELAAAVTSAWVSLGGTERPQTNQARLDSHQRRRAPRFTTRARASFGPASLVSAARFAPAPAAPAGATDLASARCGGGLGVWAVGNPGSARGAGRSAVAPEPRLRSALGHRPCALRAFGKAVENASKGICRPEGLNRPGGHSALDQASRMAA